MIQCLPYSVWGQRWHNIFIIDYPVIILDILVVPLRSRRIQDPGRPAGYNLHHSLQHNPAEEPGVAQLTGIECTIRRVLELGRNRRCGELTLGKVIFAHGPHKVASAAPRLNPAQSTLHETLCAVAILLINFCNT